VVVVASQVHFWIVWSLRHVPFVAFQQIVLITEFLEQSNHLALVEQYSLQKFELNVLNVERTLCEKVFCLIRASRADNAHNELKAKIRHIYDICMIANKEKYKEFLQSKQFVEMLRMVRDADSRQFKNAPDWLQLPLEKALIYHKPLEIWPLLLNEFNSNFSEMIYDEKLPLKQEFIEVFKLIQQQLANV